MLASTKKKHAPVLSSPFSKQQSKLRARLQTSINIHAIIGIISSKIKLSAEEEKAVGDSGFVVNKFATDVSGDVGVRGYGGHLAQRHAEALLTAGATIFSIR